MQPVTRHILEILIAEGHAVNQDMSYLERAVCWRFQSKDKDFDRTQCNSCKNRFWCWTNDSNVLAPPPGLI